MPNILIIGSSNTDMVIKTSRFPQAGETIIGGDFFLFSGGKGANQAVAAARLKGRTTFLCKVGDDLFGQRAVEGFAKEGIDTDFILTDSDVSSGVALITVNGEGENQIVVAPGANANLTPEEIEQAHEAFEQADIVLLQLEIPIEVVEYAIAKASNMGKKIILNPAPAQQLSPHVLKHLFLITPNETEAELLTSQPITDRESAQKAAQILLDKGVEHVVITLGSKGALYKSKENSFMVAAPKVEVVDTTAAGDVFNGAMAVALAESMDWQDSIGLATQAAALSVTRLGAQASAPYREEMVID